MRERIVIVGNGVAGISAAIHLEGRVIGFNMLGSRWDHPVLSRWIEEARDAAWAVEHAA